MAAQSPKIPSFLFTCAAVVSCFAATPVAAARQAPSPLGVSGVPADLRAALQQVLARRATGASPCAALAQPRPRNCADAAPSPLGSLDWLAQVVVGDDLADYAMFGAAVSVDGGTALVGSPQYDPLGDAYGAGAAYVFTRTADGWTQSQKLVAGDGALGDNFGISVALHGDTALVGSYKATVDGHAEQGAVYVFRALAGAWTQTQKLSPADAGAGRMFGAWIALDGDNALVSTPAGMMGDDPTTAPVYALRRSGGSWDFGQRIDADDYVVGDAFGLQTALRGDTALIGAPGATIGANAAQGAAYVYRYADGRWTPSQKLVAGDGEFLSAFGWSVALGERFALIGAPYANVGDAAMQGAAYVFALEDGRWDPMQKLTPAIGGDDVRFGLSVAMSGDTAVVASAWTDHVEDVPSYGGTWPYVHAGDDGFVAQAPLASPADDVSSFGYATALSGGTLLVGAPIDGGASVGYAMFVTRDRVFANGFDDAAH